MDTFNKKVAEDEKLKGMVEGKERTVVMEVTDGESYNFELKDCTLQGPNKGDLEAPDVRVTADTATFTGIFDNEINPLKAYASKKLKLKASFGDLLLLQKLFK